MASRYGVGEHSDARWGDRYGEGTLAGKRAMLVVTTGGWESHYGPRGINGPIDDVLFPIQHGILYYPGFDVLPPFVVYRTSRIDEEKYLEVRDALGKRLGQSLEYRADTVPSAEWRRLSDSRVDAEERHRAGPRGRACMSNSGIARAYSRRMRRAWRMRANRRVR